MSEEMVSQIKVEEVVTAAAGVTHVATQIVSERGNWGPPSPAFTDLAVDLPAPLNPPLLKTAIYRITIGVGVPTGRPTVHSASIFTGEDADPKRAHFRLM